MNVCLCEDDYVRQLEYDQGNALWRAQLSDGTVAVMDDFRPGLTEHSAWVRLGHYLACKNLSITKFWISFRSNRQYDALPANADGYFFCKSACCHINDHHTNQLYLLGVLLSGKLMVQHWLVPELILLEMENRDPEKAGLCLIRNNR